MILSWPDAEHIYLSPHPDDVVLSCGGTVYEQAARGERVAVITVFGASPPAGEPLTEFATSLHGRWQASAAAAAFDDAPAARRAEDAASFARLHPSVELIHLPLTDCIYRHSPEGEPLYDSEESLFGRVHPNDPALDLLAEAPPLPQAARLYAPLGAGGHVDHKVLRLAMVEWGAPARRVWYYEDYPYVAEPGVLATTLALHPGLERVVNPLGEAALAAKVRAAAAHESQISTFWEDAEALDAALRAYAAQAGGERFWRARG